jgi:hypothetical protein
VIYHTSFGHSYAVLTGEVSVGIVGVVQSTKNDTEMLAFLEPWLPIHVTSWRRSGARPVISHILGLAVP